MLHPQTCQRGCVVQGNIPLSYGLVTRECPPTVPTDESTHDRIFGKLTYKQQLEKWQVEVNRNQRISTAYQDAEEKFQRKMIRKTADREVKRILKLREEQVFSRRERLRDLLEYEEAAFVQEMEARMETMGDRQLKVMAALKSIRAKREEQRQAVVKAKLKQKDCIENEALRAAMSEQHKVAVLSDRREQLREKAALQKLNDQQAAYFDRVWYLDYLRKVEKEEQEAQELHVRTADMLNALNQQMTAKEAYSQKLKKLKEEEKLLRIQQQHQFEEEVRREAEHEREKRKQIGAIRKSNIDLAAKAKSAIDAEDKEFDALAVRLANESLLEENHLKEQRKRELHEETLQYMAYLTEQKIKRKEDDTQMECLIAQEAKKQLQKRMETICKAEEIRQKGFDDMLRTRAEQLLVKAEMEKKDQERDQQMLEESLRAQEENDRLKAKVAKKNHDKEMKTQQDLLGQMEYQRSCKEQERREALRMLSECTRQEEKLDSTLAEIMSNPRLGNLHPMRLCAREVVGDCEPRPHTDTTLKILEAAQEVNSTKSPFDGVPAIRRFPDYVPLAATNAPHHMADFNILSFYAEDNSNVNKRKF